MRRGGFRPRIHLDLGHADGATIDERDNPLEMRAITSDFWTQRNDVGTLDYLAESLP
jgi:hypothetical protein